jgi:hypothetical protein
MSFSIAIGSTAMNPSTSSTGIAAASGDSSALAFA